MWTKGDLAWKLYPLCLTTLFPPVNKAGATLCWQEAALQSTFSQNLNKGCGNTSLSLVFSTYILFLPPVKNQRGTQIPVLLPPPLFLSPPPPLLFPQTRQEAMSCLIYSKGFGGDVGSDFEELRQTKTGKLKSALQIFMLNLCSFSEENLLYRWMIFVQKKINLSELIH